VYVSFIYRFVDYGFILGCLLGCSLGHLLCPSQSHDRGYFIHPAVGQRRRKKQLNFACEHTYQTKNLNPSDMIANSLNNYYIFIMLTFIFIHKFNIFIFFLYYREQLIPGQIMSFCNVLYIGWLLL